jgi:hypothetical protein
MWIIGVELASYHTSGAVNFEKTPEFLENLCASAIKSRTYTFDSSRKINVQVETRVNPTTFNCDKLLRRAHKTAKIDY